MKNKTILLSFFALSLFGLPLFAQAQNSTSGEMVLPQTYANTSDLPQQSERPLHKVVREMPKATTPKNEENLLLFKKDLINWRANNPKQLEALNEPTKSLVLQKKYEQLYDLMVTADHTKNKLSIKKGGAYETK
jgi:hypothetical protein